MSFRRRRSSIRVWSKEQEQQLTECERLIQPEELAGRTRGEQLLHRWTLLGYNGYTEEELVKKLESIHRIHEMLKTTEDETAHVHRSRSGSLIMDAQWEEDTLNLVKEGKVEEFRERLQRERRTSLVADAKNRTALHHAASAGNLTLSRMLVDSGADIEAKDNEGKTPLFFALQHAWDEVVMWLLNQGACATVSDLHGVTPLHLAAYNNSRKAVMQLLAIPDVNPNCQDEKGRTPLHVAAHRASVAIVEALLHRGADPSIRDKRGNLPSALAKRMSKPDNYRCLTSFKTASATVLATLKLRTTANLPIGPGITSPPLESIEPEASPDPAVSLN